MNSKSCPICYSDLIVLEVTPCMDCGGIITDEQKNKKYTEYEIMYGLSLILCDFCSVDFGSYDVTYFGLESNKSLGFEHFNFIKEVEYIHSLKDKYCTECKHRLAFLEFVKKCRI